MTFEQLNIINPILKAIALEGYQVPSPIQEQAIPVLLDGHDMLASAQTGTGKTAAFAIPIIQALYNQAHPIGQKKQIQALILAPTRELAEQIKDSFRNYSKHLGIKTEVVYGGVSQRNQETALNKGVDVLIATPGRLIDLMNQGIIHLDFVKFFVLDEADRMLDMGFIHDVKRIATSLPKVRQTMLFSATIPSDISKLAKELLTEPIRIEVTPPEQMIDKIKQSLYYVTKKDKVKLLIDLLVNPKLQSVLVFTKTKHGANKLVTELVSYGIKADAIHGNKSQSKRQTVLNLFKQQKLRVLVATDIAARGIDIDELSHVINYDLPDVPETYVHRMGRTGRAGLTGETYSFCSMDENHLLISMEKHIQAIIPVITNHPYHVSKQIIALPSQEINKKKSRSTLKNKTIKDHSKTMKKNLGERQKKSYHELNEEKSFEKDVFKRSNLPKKNTVAHIDIKSTLGSKSKEVSNKGYLPKDYDRGEKNYRSKDRFSSESKKTYTPGATSNERHSPKPQYQSSKYPNSVNTQRSNHGNHGQQPQHKSTTQSASSRTYNKQSS